MNDKASVTPQSPLRRLRRKALVIVDIANSSLAFVVARRKQWAVHDISNLPAHPAITPRIEFSNQLHGLHRGAEKGRLREIDGRKIADADVIDMAHATVSDHPNIDDADHFSQTTP